MNQELKTTYQHLGYVKEGVGIVPAVKNYIDTMSGARVRQATQNLGSFIAKCDEDLALLEKNYKQKDDILLDGINKCETFSTGNNIEGYEGIMKSLREEAENYNKLKQLLSERIALARAYRDDALNIGNNRQQNRLLLANAIGNEKARRLAYAKRTAISGLATAGISYSLLKKDKEGQK